MPTSGPLHLLSLCLEWAFFIFSCLAPSCSLVLAQMSPPQYKVAPGLPTTSSCLNSLHCPLLFSHALFLCSLVYFLSPSPKSKLHESRDFCLAHHCIPNHRWLINVFWCMNNVCEENKMRSVSSKLAESLYSSHPSLFLPNSYRVASLFVHASFFFY